MTGKIITIAQQKGGSGKTTLTANLATALASRGNRVAILDTDPQGSLGRWYMTRCEKLGSDNLIGFRTASAWGARYEARELLKSHDMVLIDTPPKMGVDGRPALETADLVVVPVAPSKVDLWATEPTIAMVQGESKPVLMVLNRASRRTRLTGEMRSLLAEFGCDCADTLVGNRVLFAETLGIGLSATERRPNGPAAREVFALADELEARLQRVALAA
ncbi:MAG: ParA family partition ATPase [Hyphomicrobiales bacterium]